MYVCMYVCMCVLVCVMCMCVSNMYVCLLCCVCCVCVLCAGADSRGAGVAYAPPNKSIFNLN